MNMSDKQQYIPVLKHFYVSQVIPQMMKEFEYTNIMQVPKLDKIVLNMGVGKAVSDKKLITSAAEELTVIAGQRAIITKAKKSIASFKLRQGMPIGVKVTLRKDRMYDFLIRLINIALPRVRDFRGLSKKAFDGLGNYSFGINEQIVFPEINYDKISEVRGLQVVICSTAKTDKEALKLLSLLNMPIN